MSSKMYKNQTDVAVLCPETQKASHNEISPGSWCIACIHLYSSMQSQRRGLVLPSDVLGWNLLVQEFVQTALTSRLYWVWLGC